MWIFHILYCNDLIVMYAWIRQIITTTTNRLVPIIKNLSKVKEKWKTPVGKEVRTSIKNKNKLWKRYIKFKDNKFYEEYKLIRNKIRNQTRFLVYSEMGEEAVCPRESPCVSPKLFPSLFLLFLLIFSPIFSIQPS